MTLTLTAYLPAYLHAAFAFVHSGRSIRIGGQSTALLRAALAWAAQGSLSDDPKEDQPAAALYGDFRAASEGAEEVLYKRAVFVFLS